MIWELIGSFFVGYLIAAYVSYRLHKKSEAYGGNGKFECLSCKQPLTFRDTIHRVKCPFCKRYF